jgi:RNA polymerase sigma factor for flagellar operon FliA
VGAFSQVLEPDSPEVLARFHGELDLVEIIANQVTRSLGSHGQRDDLVSAGREGLLDAARRYDTSRGIPFRAFANFRVRGSMLDAVRKMSSLPRRVYERLLGAQAATLASEGEAEYAFSNATAVVDQGAAEGALADHLAGMATAAAMGVVADPNHDGGSESRSGSNPEEEFSRAELVALLRRTIETFPPDEIEILQRFYFQEHRLEDIARDLNVSKSWTSRLHTRAIGRLTKRIRDEL